MPKKDGVTKTYSFSRDTICKMETLCKHENRSQTNLIETLIQDKYKTVGKEI